MKPQSMPHVWCLTFEFGVESDCGLDAEIRTVLGNMEDSIARLVSEAFLNLHKVGRCRIHTVSGLRDMPNAMIESGIVQLPENLADMVTEFEQAGLVPEAIPADDDLVKLMESDPAVRNFRKKKFND